VVPIIDGLPDCGLPRYSLAPAGWDGDAATPDAVVQYGVAVRPDGLYVYAVVTDPTPIAADPGAPLDTGDALEIYFDADGVFAAPPAYDDPGTRRVVIGAPRPGEPTAARGELWTGATLVQAPWSSSSFQARTESFGYEVEAFVTASDLGLPSLALAPGGKIGWDLAVDVSLPTDAMTGAHGHRLGRYYLHVGKQGEVPDANVGAFCTPVLQ
jgi:hypothetical protein